METPGSFGYQLVLEGHLEDTWSELFDGLVVEYLDSGSTRVTGRMDQARIHGLFRAFRDRAVSVQSLNRLFMNEEESMQVRTWVTLTTLVVLGALPVGAETLLVTETAPGLVSRQTEQRTKVALTVGGWTETIVSGKETLVRTFDGGGALVIVEWTGPEGIYRMGRDGDTVKVAGTYRGKTVAGNVDLKGRLWDRGGGALDFTVALRALAKQGFRGTITLVTIAPDDLGRPVEMAFTKDGVETVAGRSLVRVKLGLTGVLSLLWSGLAWADPVTGDQVRLRSTRGPGTPEVLIVSEVQP